MTKRKTMYMGVLLCLGVCLLVGCNKSKMKKDTENKDNNKTNNELKTYDISDGDRQSIITNGYTGAIWSSDKNPSCKVLCDLDGNGEKEEIIFDGQIEKYEGMEEIKDVTLTIGGTKYDKKIPYCGFGLGGVSFDGKSIFLVIEYQDENRKSVYTNIVQYDGKSIIDVGDMKGTIEYTGGNEKGIKSITYLGNQPIDDMNIYYEYEYKDGKISDISNGEYVAGMQETWTTLKDVKIYTDRSLNSTSSVIKKDTEVFVKKTDAVEWVYIGEEDANPDDCSGGWINIKDNVVVSEENAKLEELFKRNVVDIEPLS